MLKNVRRLVIKKVEAYIFMTLISLLNLQHVCATEYDLSGLIDIRATSTDSSISYLKGGYGKFRYSDGENISLAQLALTLKVDWENNLSFHLLTNAYQDGETNGFGITEAFFRYRALPNADGIRFQGRFGFMYPKISLENIAVGWSSPYTLSYSTMNSWLAEEVRHVGIEGSISKLGKFSGSAHDFTLSTVLFGNNDPNGSMLSWHGWVQSSRQTFWNEKLDFPQFPALNEGQALETQAKYSDPFVELDSLNGYQILGQWDWKSKSKLLMGYYDNRGADDVVKNGQYSWRTTFLHMGFRWINDNGITLLLQHMSGNSRMTVADNVDVVAINFSNTFLMLSKKWQKFRLSTRLEQFETNDLDGITGDNNDEDGHGLTLSLAYQFDEKLLLHIEYNYINSDRPSRMYYGQLDKKQQEKQIQLAARYYF